MHGQGALGGGSEGEGGGLRGRTLWGAPGDSRRPTTRRTLNRHQLGASNRSSGTLVQSAAHSLFELGEGPWLDPSGRHARWKLQELQVYHQLLQPTQLHQALEKRHQARIRLSLISGAAPGQLSHDLQQLAPNTPAGTCVTACVTLAGHGGVLTDSGGHHRTDGSRVGGGQKDL